jgi:hypothetical protein
MLTLVNQITVSNRSTKVISGRNFIGGLVEGINFPKGKKFPILELLECNDITMVDRRYFLANKNLIESWAKQF